MKKYINGKFIKITKEELEADKKRFGHPSKRSSKSEESEARIKQLEETVTRLTSALNELKGTEVPQEVSEKAVQEESPQEV